MSFYQVTCVVLLEVMKSHLVRTLAYWCFEVVGVDLSKILSVRVLTDMPRGSSNKIHHGSTTCSGNECLLLNKSTFWYSDVGNGKRLDAELYLRLRTLFWDNVVNVLCLELM